MEGAKSNKAQNNRGGTKISIACAPCKNRRSKCSGAPAPCDSCVRLHLTCAFDARVDMRRRESRNDFTAFKALLEAFMISVRENDAEQSSTIYKSIELVDDSGKLAEVARSYVQAVNMNDSQSRRPSPHQLGHIPSGLYEDQTFSLRHGSDADGTSPVSAPTPSPTSNSDVIDDAAVTFTFNDERIGGYYSSMQATTPIYQVSYRFSTLPADNKPFTNFKSLQDFWAELGDVPGLCAVTNIGLPNRAYDPVLLQAADDISESLLLFRDGARRAIQAGIDVRQLIGGASPILDAYFDIPQQGHSVWSWAGSFAKTFENASRPLQLSIIFIIGIQLRVSTRLLNTQGHF